MWRAGVMDSSPLKQKLYDVGMKAGLSALAQGKHSMLADQLLFRALRDRLAHAAALGRNRRRRARRTTFKFFQAWRAAAHLLYGQTEMLGAYTLHPFGRSIRIPPAWRWRPISNSASTTPTSTPARVGEIVRAAPPTCSSATTRIPEASAADIKDGWMHSGDAGLFHGDSSSSSSTASRISPRPRRGERFSPQYLENKLKFSPYIAETVVLGAGRDALAAMHLHSIFDHFEMGGREPHLVHDLHRLPRAGSLYAVAQGGRRLNATLAAAQRISASCCSTRLDATTATADAHPKGPPQRHQ